MSKTTTMSNNNSTVDKFLINVFGCMGIGVLITAFVTLYISNSPGMLETLFSTYQYTNEDGEAATGFSASWIWWTCVAIELGIVFYISWFTNSMKSGTAWIAFMVYAGLNGITISPMIHAYTGASVALVFFVSASVFVVAAGYGRFTKKDLTSLGGYFFVAIIALIIAMVANAFFGNGMIDMLISAVAVLVFTALTAYDVQMLRELHNQQYGSSEKSLVVYGALSLYLDFINIFIHLLRLFGNKD